MLDQAVNGVVFPHVFEEVFLRPPREHPHRNGPQFGPIIGGEHTHLMAALFPLSDFTNPQAVAQTGATFGQAEGDGLAVGQEEWLGGELRFGPVLTGKLVIGDHGHALRFLAGEELRRITRPVEHQGETVEQRILRQCRGGGVVRRVGQEPGDDLGAQDLDQPRINRTIDQKAGPSSQRVDPVVSGAAQTQLLPGHVTAGQRGQFPVIDPHVAVGVIDAVVVRLGGPSTPEPVGCSRSSPRPAAGRAGRASAAACAPPECDPARLTGPIRRAVRSAALPTNAPAPAP